MAGPEARRQLLIFDIFHTGEYAKILRECGATDVTLSGLGFLWCVPCERSLLAKKVGLSWRREQQPARCAHMDSRFEHAAREPSRPSTRTDPPVPLTR